MILSVNQLNLKPNDKCLDSLVQPNRSVTHDIDIYVETDLF